ncbi:MAG: hypothetical protein KF889_06970 [Alphaproteobacteria bacterium]|nr:hypothetical protein [Alphaproteobacteria bacterium]MCW5740562.1 hypothetical protein [Alphaproteobacteria bacterium]
MTTILTDRGDAQVDARDGLKVSTADAERATGWTLKPEGMCRDEICVPLPAGTANDGRVDLAAFWRHLGNPVLSSESGDVWILGTGVEARRAALEELEAPDFTLPDLAGTPHTLSSLRGRKVFLATWASW